MKTSTLSQSAARRVRGMAARRYHRYLQRLDLEELDGRLLADIGLMHAEVRRECVRPFWR